MSYPHSTYYADTFDHPKFNLKSDGSLRCIIRNLLRISGDTAAFENFFRECYLAAKWEYGLPSDGYDEIDEISSKHVLYVILSHFRTCINFLDAAHFYCFSESLAQLEQDLLKEIASQRVPGIVEVRGIIDQAREEISVSSYTGLPRLHRL